MDTQTCPTCGATNPTEARYCSLCGTKLSRHAELADHDGLPTPSLYDFERGEDDLMIRRTPFSAVALLALLFSSATAASLALVFFVGGLNDGAAPDGNGAEVALLAQDSRTPNATASILAMTPQPTLTPSITRTAPPPLPTVTPTITPTFTPGPCIEQVQEGDTLYAMALRCGHRDIAVVDLIIEENNLPNASSLQIGQEIEIPRPSPTIDPAAIENPASGAVGEEEIAASTVGALEVIEQQRAALEPTLDPNLMYHFVSQGQTLFDIIAIYNIDVKVLSEINPEVEFPQCDFGMQFGGPNCAVFFFEGQRIRVPAPTPTPTIEPTSSGSETPTPSPTATFNVPAAFAPQDGTIFDAASIVTLRWGTSGTLGLDEVYVVRLTRRDTDETLAGITCDLMFDVPSEWQDDGVEFYEYEWSVSVADVGLDAAVTEAFNVDVAGLSQCNLSGVPTIAWDSETVDLRDRGVLTGLRVFGERFPTQPRLFFWQGGGEADATTDTMDG